MTLKNNSAPLLCNFKLCASFHSHWWIQTGVTVRKHPNWGKICFDLCDIDFWPGPFAWTSFLSMVIAPENSWWYDGRNIVEKVSDKQTDRSVLRATWLQLKIVLGTIFVESQWFIRTIKILKGHFSLNSIHGLLFAWHKNGSNTPGNRGKEPRPANRRGTLCLGASGPTVRRRIASPRSTPVKTPLPVLLWGPIEWCPVTKEAL